MVDHVSPTDNPINEAITINEKNFDFAKGSSTPVITEQANTIEEHKEQGDEEDVNDEPIISTRNGNDRTDQISEEVQERKRKLMNQKTQKGRKNS